MLISLCFSYTRKKFQISFPDTGKAHVRPRTPHTDVNRTHSRTYRFIYIDSRTDTVLLYTTCTYELYFCVHNSYKQDAHTHTDIALYILYRFLYRYTVHILYRWTVLLCTLLYNLTLPKHTLVVHTLCLDQLYCCTFIL
jgi:hypothetical protein